MIKIAPSILAANLLDIKNEIINVDVAGAEYIHVDIMDGNFVNNLSFGHNMVKCIRPITKKILDVHLMINSVESNINNYIDAGSDIISFHAENEKNPEKIIEKIKINKCKAGIAVSPILEIKSIQKLLEIIDTVIVMTVVPGFGGQKFLEDQVYKIKQLKEIKLKKNLNFKIEIDGGINNNTNKICIENGADILVAGSYIFNSHSNQYKDLIDSLRK